MYFGEAVGAARQFYTGDALSFSPARSAVKSPEAIDFTNRIPGRKGLNIRNPPQNLEVHSLILLGANRAVNLNRHRPPVDAAIGEAAPLVPS
jgi:hypothetical protein